MATLAPSLRRLFNELDATWPNRDRRTDGWYRPVSVGISVGHNPGHNGLVHAIDVDKDGIDQMWIINNIYKHTSVLWYIIWNRGIWSNTWGFTRHNYTGSNPHTDHMHIEIRQTTVAENYAGGWRIGNASGGSIIGGIAGVINGGGATQGLGSADDRDPRIHMMSATYHTNEKGNGMRNIEAYNLDTMNL